jgi:hypothetical protein
MNAVKSGNSTSSKTRLSPNTKRNLKSRTLTSEKYTQLLVSATSASVANDRGRRCKTRRAQPHENEPTEEKKPVVMPEQKKRTKKRRKGTTKVKPFLLSESQNEE